MADLDFGGDSLGSDAKDPSNSVGGMPSGFRPQVKGGLAAKGLKKGGRRVIPSVGTGKSVLTIIVQGDKDAGKSCAPAGIPAKKGRKVFIACDDTTAETLENYYGKEIYESVELYEITRRQLDENGSLIYPGYDCNNVATAEDVFGELILLLDELEQAGDVEVLVVDHFQALYEQVAKSYARAVHGLGPDDPLQFEHWMTRTDTMNQIESKIRRIPMPGGVAVITGYSAEEKFSYVDDPERKGKKRVIRTMKEPKWLKDDIRRNWLVNIHLTASAEGVTETGEHAAEHRYFAEVLGSKVAQFQKGLKQDISGKSLNVFFEAETKFDDLAKKVIAPKETE